MNERAGMPPTKWMPPHEALEFDEPIELGVAIELTEVMDGTRARAVFEQARADHGWSALIVAEGAQLVLGDFDAKARVREWVARYEEAPIAPFGAPRADDGIDAALAKLARAAGADPLDVLHRLDDDHLHDIDNEDGYELDPDTLLPEDPREAYLAGLAHRAELRGSGGRGGLVLESAVTVRPYDVPTAIAQLAPGRARVVRITTTPARALMYLGFGGWNDCPNPWEQARIWEHWARTIAGEPVVIGEATLDAIVARPITTREALVQHAREIATYCHDSVIEGWLPLLSMIHRGASLRFWWD